MSSLCAGPTQLIPIGETQILRVEQNCKSWNYTAFVKEHAVPDRTLIRGAVRVGRLAHTCLSGYKVECTVDTPGTLAVGTLWNYIVVLWAGRPSMGGNSVRLHGTEDAGVTGPRWLNNLWT